MTLTMVMVEDNPETLRVLERDLTPFAARLRIESTDSFEGAASLVEQVFEDDDELALVLCECQVGGESGVEYLVALAEDERFDSTKRVLVTGPSDLMDAVRAVNRAYLDRYVAKPWDPDELRNTVTGLLTDYVLDNDINPLPYMPCLDDERVMDIWR